MSNPSQPPLYDFEGINFNPSFFTSVTDNTASVLAFVDETYLKKIGTAISNASTTSFSGEVITNNFLISNGQTIFENYIPTTPIINNNESLTQLATVGYVNSQTETTEDILITESNNNFEYYIPLQTSYITGDYPLYSSSFFTINPFNKTIMMQSYSILQILGGSVFISNVGNTIASSINQDPNLGLTFTNNQQSQLTSFISPGGTAPFTLGSFNALAGMSIGWNKSNGTGETDLVNYGQGGVGGFNFYNTSSTTPMSLIAQIPNAQPSSLTSTNILSTTSFVQSRIATFLSSANVYSGGVGTPQSMGVLQLFSGTLLSPNVWQFTSAIQASSTPQNNLRLNMGGNQSLSFQGLSSLNTAISSVNGVSFGNLTGNTQIQNYANTGVTPGFTFSSTTNVATAKILGILPYNQPLVTDDSQNLATTAWVKAHVVANPEVLVTNTISDISYSIPIITSSATAIYPFYSGTGLSYNPSTQVLTTNIYNNSLNTMTATVTTGVLNLNCLGKQTSIFEYTMTSNITSLNMTNVYNFISSTVYINGGVGGFGVSKVMLGSLNKNNLAGFTFFGAGSLWTVAVGYNQGTYYLVFTNVT